MGILQRNHPDDVLLLMPVRLGNEKLAKSKIRMLYCDTSGKVYASIITRSVYELAEDIAKRMERSHRPFATVGLEISSGKFIPTAVEIGPKEVWALEHILEHALRNGRLPDILKRYLKPIIKLGEANREAVLSEHRKRRRRVHLEAVPRVLGRLPYYSERDIEFSMPIYKAKHSYPLVVLKNIPSDKDTLKSPQRLLILDSDGDLAIIKVPYESIDNMGKGLAEQRRKNKRNVCAIILQNKKGMTIDYMLISQPQRKALDTITRYFEETGNGKQPIPAAAKAVLFRAKGKVSFPDQ
ncbi:hypothetical protein ACFLVH_04615 [Chloroflexota bacterium]